MRHPDVARLPVISRPLRVFRCPPCAVAKRRSRSVYSRVHMLELDSATMQQTGRAGASGKKTFFEFGVSGRWTVPKLSTKKDRGGEDDGIGLSLTPKPQVRSFRPR